MVKYKRHYSFEPVNEGGPYKISGCAAFSILNMGNTVMTVNKTVTVNSEDMYRGDDCHPEIEEDFDCFLEFNNASDVDAADFTTSTPGTFGSNGSSVNPGGIKEVRAVIIKTHLTPIV